MCWYVEQRFPFDTRSPGAARRFCVEQLSSVLSDQPERAELLNDVALIVSELITNTINAAGTTAVVGLSWHRDYLRLSLTDDAPGVPALQFATRDQTHGRGLAITASLSHAWGVETSHHGDDLSKQVWAELSVAPALSRTLDCAR